MILKLFYFKIYLKKLLKINKMLIFKKVLGFKKQKWDSYKLNFSYIVKNSKYSKYKLIDQNRNLIFLFTNRKSSYNYKYKNYFNIYKKLSYLFSTKKFYKFINKKDLIMKFFESRVDFVLLKSKICFSLKSIKQHVLNKNITVDNNCLTSSILCLKSGVNIKCFFNKNYFKELLIKSNKWPVPEYVINYKTKELTFFCILKLKNFTKLFPLYLEL